MFFTYLLLDDTNANEQGEWGEQIVDHKLRKPELSHLEKYIYRDLYIESTNGYIYQIDNLLICEKGIFIIETKMILGKIYADKLSDKWTAVYENRQTPFANPIKQNDAHVNAFRNIFGDDFDYHSLIVFPRTNKPKGLADNVINAKEIANYILSFESDRKLSHEEMLFVDNILQQMQKNKKELRKKHKQQLGY